MTYNMYDHEDDYYYGKYGKGICSNELMEHLERESKTKVLKARRLLRNNAEKTPDLWDLRYNGGGLFPVLLVGPEQPGHGMWRVSNPCINLGPAITLSNSYVLLRDKNYALLFETDYPFRARTQITDPGMKVQGTLVGVDINGIMGLDRYFNNTHQTDRVKTMVAFGEESTKAFLYVARVEETARTIKDRSMKVCPNMRRDNRGVYYYGS